MEEIVHRTLQSGHVREAWSIYWDRIGNHKNLGWRVGAYERGERICRAFAADQSPETILSVFLEGEGKPSLGRVQEQLPVYWEGEAPAEPHAPRDEWPGGSLALPIVSARLLTKTIK